MSDAPQGPGWWQASDGRWYPPHLHPAAQQAQPQVQPAPSEGALQSDGLQGTHFTVVPVRRWHRKPIVLAAAVLILLPAAFGVAFLVWGNGDAERAEVDSTSRQEEAQTSTPATTTTPTTAPTTSVLPTTALEVSFTSAEGDFLRRPTGVAVNFSSRNVSSKTIVAYQVAVTAESTDSLGRTVIVRGTADCLKTAVAPGQIQANRGYQCGYAYLQTDSETAKAFVGNSSTINGTAAPTKVVFDDGTSIGVAR